MQDRKTILIGIEKESMLNFRKTLFSKGISPNEFFSYVVDLLNINDERILDLLKEIQENKTNKILNGEEGNYTPDSLYDAIEKKLLKD